MLHISVGFVIHWHESAMELHVFPILIPPTTSLSTRFLWVFPVHQACELWISQQRNHSMYTCTKSLMSMCNERLYSCMILWDSRDYSPQWLLCPWNSPGKNSRVGCHPSSRGSSRPRDQTHICYILHLLHWQRGSLPLASPGKPPWPCNP